MKENRSIPVIGIVGICGSGKTTLTARLKRMGVDCHHIAQEHSYVQAMWQKITHPDFLIYLEVSYASTLQRKKFSWTVQEYEEQLQRTHHAREHADLVIDTDALSIDEEVESIIKALKAAGLLNSELQKITPE